MSHRYPVVAPNFAHALLWQVVSFVPASTTRNTSDVCGLESINLIQTFRDKDVAITTGKFSNKRVLQAERVIHASGSQTPPGFVSDTRYSVYNNGE